MSVEELREEWGVPLYAASVVAGSCESLLETANSLRAEEIDGMTALGELIGTGVLIAAIDEALVEWEPGEDQREYKAAIQGYVDTAKGVIGQWMDDEITLADVPGLVEDDCQAALDTLEDVMLAMQESGLSENDVSGMLEELSAALDQFSEALEAEEPETTEATEEPPSAGGALDSPKGDGFYTVGEEIAVGKWHSTGTGTGCYWQRMDANQETLANHFGLAGGTVTILETDYEVEFNDCGSWEYVEGVEPEFQLDAGDSKGDGFYTVGIEIMPGKWESTGAGDGCYWERLDEYQETLGNHFGLAGGTVRILDSDYEVNFGDCGTWEYVEGVERELLPDATESKGNGFYTVGVEIAAGRWESTGTGDNCYWERLDEYQDTLDNHFGAAGGTVTILDSDYEIHFSDCGTWEYKGP